MSSLNLLSPPHLGDSLNLTGLERSQKNLGKVTLDTVTMKFNGSQ